MNNTFFTVYDFMIKDLHLSKNELLVYALIFSFSVHASEGCFASQSTIARRINVSRATVNKCLKSLCEKGLIEEKNNIKSGKRKTYLPTDLTGAVKNFDGDLSKKLTGPCQESLHNIKRDNKEYKKAYIHRQQQQSAPSFDLEKAKSFCY